MSGELASLILPVCNQGDWTLRTIESARESGLTEGTPHEIIVVDDQSTDGGCHNLPKDVLVVRTKTRLGVSKARRLAMTFAKGDVIVFSDPHCGFSKDSLTKLINLARVNWAVFQPPTKRSQESKRTAWGGKFVRNERGVALGNASQGQQTLALINTIYAMRRDVHDRIGGWPELPGCWGYSEQAMSMAVWYAGVPIVCTDSEPCIHYNQHIDKQLSFKCTTLERAINGHYVHAAFLPGSYEDHWKPILDAKHGKIEECQEALKSKEFRKFRDTMLQFKRRDESDLYRVVFNGEHPAKVDITYLLEQREAFKKHPKENSTERIKVLMRWFFKAIPGCIKGRELLDLGTGRGEALDAVKQLGVRHAEGVDLLPENSKEGTKRGRVVRTGDMSHLPEMSESWGLITMIKSLQCTKEPELAIAEAARLLKRNGWLFIAVPKCEDSTGEGHNTHFKDRRSLKKLVRPFSLLDSDTIKTTVLKIGDDDHVCLAIKKAKSTLRISREQLSKLHGREM